ncbi:MAG TPA: XrtA/PEP-CTERM system TPR-repeat protein PrsT [Burkholderiales bacterium]|nr:XrtA/PEP-CTERM system TPR-repeat protein PrsT [Burkholderiales bacterium]
MKNIRTIRAALALAVVASICACRGEDPAALMASARQYMEKREYGASIIQLKNLLQRNPDNGEARFLLGMAFLEGENPSAAQIELDKAVKLGFSSDELQIALARAALARGEADRLPERFGSIVLSAPAAKAELRALIGTAHLERARPREAARAFADALELDASNVTAQIGAARLAAARPDLAAALSRVQQALGIAPDSVPALLLKAELLEQQSRHDAAESAYRAAIAAAPARLVPRLSLILHLLNVGSPEKAMAEVAAMEATAPRDPRMLYAKALVLVRQQKFAAAKPVIFQVLKLAPDHVPSLTLAGIAALNTGALAEAESHLRQAVFDAPQAIVAKRLLVSTHLRMGKADVALSEVHELLRLGQDPSTLALAGEAYLASGDVAAAARHYEQAKALAPKDTAVRTRLGLVRFAAGEPERAINELEAASAGDANDYQADLALIANYLRKRDADRALAAVQALEGKQPENPLTYNLKGAALILKQDLAGARANFERALALQPAYMPAVNNLARLDLRENDRDAARRRYQAFLDRDPNNEPALVGLAAVLRTSAADARAIEKLLKQAVAGNPASVSAHSALINFYMRSGNFVAALGAAQAAQAALPDEPRMLQAVGMTQLAAGETRQALASFTRLAEIQRGAPEAQVLLAKAYMAAKQPDDAIRALRAALAVRPDLDTAQREIAAIYVANGRHEDALREARAVQARRPQHPLGFVLEGEIFLAQKKLEPAERAYRAALKKFDRASLAIRTHSILEAAGKSLEADALAEEWIRRHPKDASLLAYLADRDLAAQRYESAEARYRSALQRAPDRPLLLNNLAWVSHELKRPGALEYAERAHDLAPDNPAIMDTLGEILADAGQVERGLELLGRAADAAPEAHQIRLNFAKSLIKTNRRTAARRELEQLARLDEKLPERQEAVKLLGGL